MIYECPDWTNCVDNMCWESCQISAEEVSKDQQLLEMKFLAHGLDKKVTS